MPPTLALDQVGRTPSVRAEARRVWQHVVALWASCSPRHWRSPQLLIVTAITLAVAGDAATTVAMMSSGLFEEANPAAAVGMSMVGTVPYVVAASVLSTVLVVPVLGRPAGLYAWAVWFPSTAILTLKLWTVLGNATLWAAVASR